MVVSSKRTSGPKTLTGHARKVVASANEVVKAIGDLLDHETKAVTGKAKKVVATAAGAVKAASAQLDNEVKSLTKPATKAVKAVNRKRGKGSAKNTPAMPVKKAAKAPAKAPVKRARARAKG